MVFVSQRELSDVFIRALRRAEFPILYSSGFTPHPRVAFGPALQVGVIGEREYVDVLLSKMPDEGMIAKLREELPSGMEIRAYKDVPVRSPALSALVSWALYLFRGEIKGVERLKAKQGLFVKRKSGKEVDIGRFIGDVEEKEDGVLVWVRFTQDGSARPFDIANFIAPGNNNEIEIVRKGLFWEKDGKKRTPMEV